jgi:peptide chain release factor 2
LEEPVTCAPGPKPSGGIFDFDAKSERLRTVNAWLEDPTVWNDPKRAQELGKEKKALDGVVVTLTKLTSELADNIELFDMSKEEGDEAGLLTIEGEAAKLAADVEQLEFRRMFNNPADPLNCFLDIQAGAGGTEACDWASMLLRQYLKYCRAQGLQGHGGRRDARRRGRHQERHDQGRGRVRLRPAAHRNRRAPPGAQEPVRQLRRPPHLVRLAVRLPRNRRLDRDRDQPGRCAHRHLPRQSGAGGQHINKTDSAVRLTHIPTGIVVQCQDGRSQHSNRDVAWKRLRSRLYDFEMRKRMEEQQKLEDTKTDVGWGHQIRSYVLDNSRIKDLRTNVEVSATQKVLDGDLDAFIEASLKQGV